MVKLNLVQAINQALEQEMAQDDRVVILGEDVGVNGGVFRVTDGLIDKFGPDRVIDTPLSEAGIIGTSIGMAVYGLRPVPEIQFMGFLAPGFDQIISHLSRIRWRSRGRFTAPVVIRVPYGGGIRALEHHSESLEAIYVHTPGMKVVVPSRPYDAKGLLISAIRDPDPVLFMEPKRIYRAFKEEVPEEPYEVPIGTARVVREGEDVTVISWGAMMRVTLEGVERVAEQGIDAEVIDLRTMMPLDIETVLASVQKTGRAVVVHEAPRTAGLGAELSARIGERALLYLEAPVARVAGFHTPTPLAQMEKEYLPDANRVVDGIEQVMNF
ncbi:MAG: alpha-ketoacid dehydrogenase subunit beta [Candidatus Bipolaricaulia bacterium]